MPIEVGLRFRSTANWLLLCLNILLLIFLAFHCLLPLDRAVARIRKDAATLGMDVYCARGPFTLFVDKDFPHKDTFKLFDYSQPLILAVENGVANDGDATKEAAIVLGADFSISCEYSLSNGVQVRALTLSKKNESLIDLNADGSFDVRIHVPSDEKPRPPSEIWYQGKWREVVSDGGGDKYRKQVAGGGAVCFDTKSGVWLPFTDKSVSGGY